MTDDEDETDDQAQDASGGGTGVGAGGDAARLAYRREVRAAKRRKGLVMVFTGVGKGKTTAAFGMAFRARGRGLRVGVVQFIKPGTARFGEIRAARDAGIEVVGTGDGWTWTSKDLDESAALARHGWSLVQERILEGVDDLLVLDEFTYTMHYGWLDTAEVVAWLREHKPPMLHVAITGRYAPDALVEFADLVTEMQLVKHPFADQGIRGQPGVEF
ncbi:MAG: cob(I)yrinic acid a,c-diamide adenosyltransferase [Dehalococcoidia bacterium]